MYGGNNTALGTSSLQGDSFTNATCDYNNDPTIEHDAAAAIIAGLGVSGTGIPLGAYIASINSGTSFELSASTTGGSVTNGTLTFYSRVQNTVAIGYGAGLNARSCDHNVFVGAAAAGLGVVTGDANVCVGYSAGYDLTSGCCNVVIGKDAALNATSTASSVYIGASAGGLGIITGANNTVIGNTAGYDLTSGASNVLIGTQAGANLTAGVNNIAIGHGALDAADTASARHACIAIGLDALGGQTAAVENCVAIGTYALA